MTNKTIAKCILGGLGIIILAVIFEAEMAQSTSEMITGAGAIIYMIFGVWGIVRLWKI